MSCVMEQRIVQELPPAHFADCTQVLIYPIQTNSKLCICLSSLQSSTLFYSLPFKRQIIDVCGRHVSVYKWCFLNDAFIYALECIMPAGVLVLWPPSHAFFIRYKCHYKIWGGTYPNQSTRDLKLPLLLLKEQVTIIKLKSKWQLESTESFDSSLFALSNASCEEGCLYLNKCLQVPWVSFLVLDYLHECRHTVLKTHLFSLEWQVTSCMYFVFQIAKP